MTGLALELTRSLRWSLLVAGVLVPVTAATLVRAVMRPDTPVEERVEVASALVCEAARLDEEVCPAGLHCIAGTCEALRREVRREAGEACGETLCAAGLECFRGACTSPEALPLAAEVCRTPAVRAAITYLRGQCAARLGDPGASLQACTAAAWQAVSETDPQFEGQLAALPGVFSVHFAQGQPDVQLRWATPEIRAEYGRQLADHGEALATAKQVLVIGRASVEGEQAKNQALAARRATLTEELLRRGIAALPPTTRWGLASDHALAPELFAVPPVAWTRGEAERLRQTLARDLNEVPGESWRWVQSTINRVALVVPLYCDGTEYHPTPAFQGGQESRR